MRRGSRVIHEHRRHRRDRAKSEPMREVQESALGVNDVTCLRPIDLAGNRGLAEVVMPSTPRALSRTSAEIGEIAI
jgi:hypothetical protein